MSKKAYMKSQNLSLGTKWRKSYQVYWFLLIIVQLYQKISAFYPWYNASWRNTFFLRASRGLRDCCLFQVGLRTTRWNNAKWLRSRRSQSLTKNKQFQNHRFKTINVLGVWGGEGGGEEKGVRRVGVCGCEEMEISFIFRILILTLGFDIVTST